MMHLRPADRGRGGRTLHPVFTLVRDEQSTPDLITPPIHNVPAFVPIDELSTIGQDV